MGFFKIDESSESTEFTVAMIVALFLVGTSYVLSYVAIHRLRWTFVSEAAVALVVGICAGGVMKSFGKTEKFQMSIFYDVLLPPVIFSSGYSMSRRWFFANIYPILGYALIGTAISSTITGGLLWLVAKTSALDLELNFNAALAFGSLISATDPVTTLAIFQELKVESKLFYIIFGESVLNDAVAIVLFETLSQTMHGEDISIGVAVGKFFFVFVASMILGWIFGCLSALAFKHGHFEELAVEIIVLLLFFYIPYLVGEFFSVSGIVAILFTGITMKHYTHRNLSSEAADLSEIAVSLTSSISETFIFLNLGTSVWSMSHVSFSFVLWSLLIILVARASQVYPLSFLFNSLARNDSECLERNQMHMLWYSGLRGAISYALAVDFPEESGVRNEVKSCTMILVLVTILGFGTATVPMLQLLGIRRKSSKKKTRDGVEGAGPSSESSPIAKKNTTGSRDNTTHDNDDDDGSTHESKRENHDRPDSSRFVKMHSHCTDLLEFDRKYIQPCLVRKSRVGQTVDDTVSSSIRLSLPLMRGHDDRCSTRTQVVDAEEVVDDVEDDELLGSCGNRGSLRNLSRVGGRWWMRSMNLNRRSESRTSRRFVKSRRYANLAFTELKDAAEKVLKEGRPRFATKSMLVHLLESERLRPPAESDARDEEGGDM